MLETKQLVNNLIGEKDESKESTDNNLTDKSFFDWDSDDIKQLKKQIITKVHKFLKSHKVSRKIYDILITGSRTYEVDGKTTFVKESDLDTIIVIDDSAYNKLYDLMPDKINNTYFLTLKCKQCYFKYKGVLITLSLVSYSIYTNDLTTTNRFLYQWRLPLYSLYYHRFYNVHVLDTINYLTSYKNRDLQLRCIFCGAPLQDNSMSIGFVINKPHFYMYRLPVCEKCADNIDRAMKHLANKIDAKYPAYNVIPAIKRQIK